MIIGKSETYEQKISRLRHWHPYFSIVPRQLDDGRWIIGRMWRKAKPYVDEYGKQSYSLADWIYSERK